MNDIFTTSSSNQKMYSNTKEFVDLLKHKDKNAFSDLYSNYSASLMGIIRPIVNSTECAEDVLQETFIKINRSILTYDADKGTLFTWMARTAKNTAIDQLRKRTRLDISNQLNLEEISKEIENNYSESYNPDTIGIRRLAEALPNSYKDITNLIYFQGYTHSEAAKELGIPIGTLKTRLRASIQVLKKHFNQI